MLGRVVGGAVGDAGQPSDGGYVYDAAGAPLEHYLPESTSKKKRRNQIDLENTAKGLHVYGLRWSYRADAGIVYQNIDLVPSGAYRFGSSIDDRFVGDVSRKVTGVCAAGAEAGEGGSTGLKIQQRQRVASDGEDLSGTAPNALGGSGDDG
jgi:hypothetical protein